ncbi:MAG: TSUP family transporter [Rhodospirillaceae bacterium]
MEADNAIVFCTRPWRIMGAAVAGLVAITMVWGVVILTTYSNDDRFGNDKTLSVTEFMSRNVALPGSFNLPDVIAPAVVAIDGGKINGGVVASGAIVGANGYVLTTLHSIEGLSEITVHVRTKTGIQNFTAQVVKKAPLHDLVLLKIQSPGSFLYLSLADTVTKPIGTVYAFGQGTQGNLVVRQGGVSNQSVPLAIEALQISHLRSTDAVYTWEQNGGPVVNGDGAIVGVTIAVRDAAGGVRGYVVPADVIMSHFRDVLNFKTVTPSTPASVAPAAAITTESGAPRMVAAGLTPAPAFGAGPLSAGTITGGSGAWWIKAANQVGAGAAQPTGYTAPPGGAPVASGVSADVEHLLGLRIAGFAVEDLIGLTILALVKGVIGGMMTMGGGVFLVAGMMMFFGYGLFLIRPVAYLTNIFVYSASSLRHHRNGLVMWDEVKTMAPWAIIGVIIGYFIGNAISDRVIEVLLAIFAVMISIKAAHEVWFNESDDILLTRNGDSGTDDDDLSVSHESVEDELPPAVRQANPFSALTKPALLALPMGIISGILGITGGVIEVPLQHYIGKVPLKNAIANSAVLVFFASLTGTLLAFIHGTATGIIDWQTPLTLAAILIPASFVGGIAGAHLTKLAPKPALKVVFSVLMMAVAIRMFIGH